MENVECFKRCCNEDDDDDDVYDDGGDTLKSNFLSSAYCEIKKSSLSLIIS